MVFLASKGLHPLDSNTLGNYFAGSAGQWSMQSEMNGKLLFCPFLSLCLILSIPLARIHKNPTRIDRISPYLGYILCFYFRHTVVLKWNNLRFLNNWCCDLNELKCSPKVLSGVGFMRWFTGYKVCMVLSWGFYLWICQFWTFSIIFSMEFEVGHLKEPFFMSGIPFCLMKKCGHIHEL